MGKKNLIIIVILVIIVIVLLLYIIINNNNRNRVWCNIDDPLNIIKGKIIKVSNVGLTENEFGTILIRQDNNEADITVRHNSDINFKVGQYIIVTHTGLIKENKTLQVKAICIKIEKS